MKLPKQYESAGSRSLLVYWNIEPRMVQRTVWQTHGCALAHHHDTLLITVNDCQHLFRFPTQTIASVFPRVGTQVHVSHQHAKPTFSLPPPTIVLANVWSRLSTGRTIKWVEYMHLLGTWQIIKFFFAHLPVSRLQYARYSPPTWTLFTGVYSLNSFRDRRIPWLWRMCKVHWTGPDSETHYHSLITSRRARTPQCLRRPIQGCDGMSGGTWSQNTTRDPLAQDIATQNEIDVPFARVSL